MPKTIDEVTTLATRWCNDDARKARDELKGNLDHLIEMESGRPVKLALDPVQNMLRVFYDIPQPNRWTRMTMDDAERKVYKKGTFNPGKIAIANKLVDVEKLSSMDEWNRNIEMDKIAATLITKGAFVDGFIAQVQEIYDRERKSNWEDELKRDRSSSDFKRPSINDGDIFKACRVDGTPRATCAAGMDKAERACNDAFDKVEKLSLPRDPPGEPDVVKAAARMYPPETVSISRKRK